MTALVYSEPDKALQQRGMRRRGFARNGDDLLAVFVDDPGYPEDMTSGIVQKVSSF